MNLLPKIGVDEIRLGMNRKNIIDILGKATTIENKVDYEYWIYDFGMELAFSTEDLYLLASITVTNPSALLDSKRIIGLGERELIEAFPFLNLEGDFEENGKDYVCPIRELSVWVSEGKVTNVTLFPEYEPTGSVPLWPKRGT